MTKHSKEQPGLPFSHVGPWLPRAAGADRQQRTGAVLKEFVLGPQKKPGCQTPWRKFVDVACPDAEAKESANASHFTAAGAREIFDTILKPNIIALLK